MRKVNPCCIRPMGSLVCFLTQQRHQKDLNKRSHGPNATGVYFSHDDWVFKGIFPSADSHHLHCGAVYGRGMSTKNDLVREWSGRTYFFSSHMAG